MKKRIVSIFLCMAMAMSMTACGGNKDAGETAETASAASSAVSASAEVEEEEDDYDYGITLLEGEDYNVDDCITLGDYKGMEFTKTVEPVTDADITLKIMQLTGDSGEELKDPDAEVQMGDTAVIDYTGKKDGVAFDGGTSTAPYNLQIGSGSFIPGFEEGVVGMKAGETKDIELTFPENYQAADLAGAEVVFTVELHSIKRLVITDEWVKENAGTDYKNAEDYIASNRKVLEEQNETEAQNKLYGAVWQKVMESSEFKAVPEILVKNAEKAFKDNIKKQADAYGYTMDDFFAAVGVTKEQYLEQVHTTGLQRAKEKILLEALSNAEGLDTNSPEYQTALDEMVTDSGAASADELIQSYGQENIDDMLMSTVLVERILTYTKVLEE